jgi:hypothetical protein
MKNGASLELFVVPTRTVTAIAAVAVKSIVTRINPNERDMN